MCLNHTCILHGLFYKIVTLLHPAILKKSNSRGATILLVCMFVCLSSPHLQNTYKTLVTTLVLNACSIIAILLLLSWKHKNKKNFANWMCNNTQNVWTSHLSSFWSRMLVSFRTLQRFSVVTEVFSILTKSIWVDLNNYSLLKVIRGAAMLC